jgi:hypothetical protein
LVLGPEPIGEVFAQQGSTLVATAGDIFINMMAGQSDRRAQGFALERAVNVPKGFAGSRQGLKTLK